MKRTAAALLHEALANFEERGDVTACNDAELERILAHLRRVVGSIELEQQKKPLLYRLFGVARHAGLGAQVPSCCDCWTLTALAVTSKAVQRLTKEHLYRACAIRLPAVRGGPPVFTAHESVDLADRAYTADALNTIGIKCSRILPVSPYSIFSKTLSTAGRGHNEIHC